jgi:hypothetical protein
MNRSKRSLALGAPIFVIVLLFFGALWAQKPDRQPTGDAVPSTAEEVVVRTTQEKQDSLFALIDENFKLVKPIIQFSCFDCHSSNTKFPWYHKLPLIKGMIDKDISSARKKVDFSDGFPFAGKASTLEILKDMRDEIDQGDMPLWTYRLMHWGTSIDGARKDSVFTWLDTSIVMVERFYDAEKIPYKKDKPAQKDSDD